MKVLVIGGAGYIGSHMVKLMISKGISAVTLDNCSTGYRDAISGGEVVEADIGDKQALDLLFARHQFDGVVHFASYIQVGESIIAQRGFAGGCVVLRGIPRIGGTA